MGHIENERGEARADTTQTKMANGEVHSYPQQPKVRTPSSINCGMESKLGQVQTMEYFSDITKEEVLTQATACMNLTSGLVKEARHKGPPMP